MNCIIERLYLLDGCADCRCLYFHCCSDSLTHCILLFIYFCRIHELQEDIIKVKLDLENAQKFIKHLNTQVGNKLTGSI